MHYLKSPLTCCAAALALGLALGTWLPAQSTQRITRAGFMKSIEIGGIEADELISIVQARGVDFTLTDADRSALASRGVPARVLDAVSANHRAGPPRPAAPPPAAPAAAEPPPAARVAAAAPEPDEIVAGGARPIAAPASAPAVVVIVGKDNPLTSIDKEQLRRIFSGETTAWKNGRPIFVVNRELPSEARRVFYKTVLKSAPGSSFYVPGSPIPFRPPVQEPASAVKAYVARMPGAIGYIEPAELDQTVKVLAINGVAPSEQTIANRSYPLVADK